MNAKLASIDNFSSTNGLVLEKLPVVISRSLETDIRESHLMPGEKFAVGLPSFEASKSVTRIDCRAVPLRAEPSVEIETAKRQQVDCIVAAAKQRLQQRSHLTMQRIWCEFQEGNLFLRGQVPSFYHKQLAQTAVAGIEGVDQVVNDIEVVW